MGRVLQRNIKFYIDSLLDALEIAVIFGYWERQINRNISAAKSVSIAHKE